MDFIITLLGIVSALIASGALALVVLFLTCDAAAEKEERKRYEKQENH
jgi:hypothetical protein